MTKCINRTPAHLLQAIFQFPNQELATVEEQTGLEVQQALNTALAALREPAARVCRYFYGIGCQPMTLAEIASEFGIKPDQVGRFKSRSVRRLRHISLRGPLALRLQESGVRFAGLAEAVAQIRSLEERKRQLPIDLARQQFGRDHAPSCTDAEPCPTCRVWTLLERAGLRKQFAALLEEWLALPKSGADLDLAELEFSVRTEKGLKDDGLTSLDLIAARTETEILRIPNLGRKSLNEVKEVLKYYGRRLSS